MNPSETAIMQRRASETLTIRRVAKVMDKGADEVQRLREENTALQERVDWLTGNRNIWRSLCMNFERLARLRLKKREEAEVG